MGIARSTYYDCPKKTVDDTSIVEAMFAICDKFEFYGYRRVGAALRQQGLVINHRPPYPGFLPLVPEQAHHAPQTKGLDHAHPRAGRDGFRRCVAFRLEW